MRFLNRRLCVALFLALTLGIAALAQQMNKHGFDVSNLDKTCKPCEDFFQYANGGWLARNEIPAAFSSWGTTSSLAEKNRTTLRQILEDAAKNTNAPAGSNEQKIGAFYASCMDEAKIEAEGAKPLQPELARIDKINDQRALQAEIARFHTLGVPALFGFGSAQDFKKSTQVIGGARQGGLSLPNRDYYVNDNEKSKQLREGYVKHVARMFELLGDDADKSAAEAKAVLDLETTIAKNSRDRVQLRDISKQYNKMNLAELQKLTPNFVWADYLKNINAPQINEVNVGQPEFFQAADKLLVSVPLNDWKTYLRWHLVNDTADALSSKFVNEDFDFKGRTLTGAKENQPRWRRCVAATDASLGEALGEVYVQKAFTPEAKARMQKLVGNLIAALRTDLATIDWMGDATRKQAIAKLEAFTTKIGYPDKWRDYSALKIERASYFDNAFRSAQFATQRQLRKIGKPVDRTEWGMTPPTVNAYNNSLMNEIVFPAGILQPPYFDPNADDAVNYGAIGAVIGHEMTHGFDDQGRKFDASGNLSEWWSPDDLKNYQARADCVEKQFSGFKVEEGLNQNGKLVLGESIADLGGLKLAYLAFQKSMEGKPRTAEIDGFTPEQRFFLGWAQVWGRKYRPEAMRLQALTDPHPLSRFRVNGPLSNMPAFAEAFGCKEGEAMVRPAKERCEVW
ncbi:MAG: M13 family metallopeptidase [Pyrinomonadaceae bacterium]